MEAATLPNTGTQTPPPAPAAAGGGKRERGPTTYSVYRATGDDVAKEGIASQLNLIKRGVVADNELAARWQVVDGDPALTAIANGAKPDDGDYEVLFLVAIPERRVVAKRTMIERKVDERRV